MARKISWTWVVLLLILLLASPFIAIVIQSTAVVSGWGIYSKLDTLYVSGESATGSNYAIELDPDGPITGTPGITPIIEGQDPAVYVGMSSALTLSDEPPQPITGYTMYRYLFGIDFKTDAKQITGTVYYESEQVPATAKFTVGLQEDIGGAEVAAKIMDVAIESYESGLTEFPNMPWEHAVELMSEGLDPSKNVEPRVITHEQINQGLIETINTNRTNAQCSLSVSLRAGGVIEWSGIGIFPYADDVHIYNVFANYLLKVDVAVEETGDGDGAPPSTNPWDYFIIMLQDFGMRIQDIWDQWGERYGWVIIILTLILVAIILFITCYLVGRFRKRR